LLEVEADQVILGVAVLGETGAKVVVVLVVTGQAYLEKVLEEAHLLNQSLFQL
tara:strand:- start:547 stop:705 length:159 start_codon:yes stop_codon:yes gene_type:complete